MPSGPDTPTLRGALRAAAVDFYFNSMRLVSANVLWGALLVIILLTLIRAPGPLTAILFVFLVLPTVGLYRLSALIVRGEFVAFSDGLQAQRRHLGVALAAGTTIAACAGVFVTNIILGITNPSILGWVVMTFAAWGLATLWVGTLAFWPLLVDPARTGRGARAAARLAALLVLAHPIRLAALGLVSGAVILVSTVAFVALLTIAVAFVSLVGCRYVLPAADRLEAALEAKGKRA